MTPHAQLRVVTALAVRALRTAFRRPTFLAPIFIFPSLFLAINVGGAGSAVNLPGFPPVHGFLDFQLAGATVQAAMLSAVSAGTALALDIEGGFIDRLMAAPISRWAIIGGRLLANVVLGFMAAVWFLGVGLIFGAKIEGDLAGALVVIALGGLTAGAFGAIGAGLAVRSGRVSVVQGTFPLVFVILFLSSAYFPEALLQQPAKAVSELNPMSYIADGLREPVIAEITSKVTIEALVGIVVVAAIGLAWCAAAMRRRLRTT